MNARIVAFLMLIATQAAFAEGAKGFINGGLSLVGYEVTDNQGFTLELEEGGGLHFAGGVRLDNGIVLRGSYSGSSHDGGVVCVPGCATFTNEVELDELRFVVLFSPDPDATIGVEFGGGYEALSSEISSLGIKGDSDGLVLEGALLIKAGDSVRFDVGAALMVLENDNSEDMTGGEFRIGAVVQAGRLELGVSLRGLHLETELTGGGTEEEDASEIRATIGTTWDM